MIRKEGQEGEIRSTLTEKEWIIKTRQIFSATRRAHSLSNMVLSGAGLGATTEGSCEFRVDSADRRNIGVASEDARLNRGITENADEEEDDEEEETEAEGGKGAIDRGGEGAGNLGGE